MPSEPPINLDDFNYDLPEECIAQHPCERRDAARLFVLDRAADTITHASVSDLPQLLQSNDLLVTNASRVVRARLRGNKQSRGGAEALILGSVPGAAKRYRALVRCRGRLRVGLEFEFSAEGKVLQSEIVELLDEGEVVLEFLGETSPYEIGEMPLPPYIRRKGPESADEARYQTVFARVDGSVAAPTAGLHFTEELLRDLAQKRIRREEVLLHVGPGTFRPLSEASLRSRELHSEAFELPLQTVNAIQETREQGGRVVAVGTTTTRVLESCGDKSGALEPGMGETRLFLYPGCTFGVVDALLTNFHLPRSSLLLLVAAFVGRKRLLDCYAEAVREGYRFYSYGDAMLIL